MVQIKILTEKLKYWPKNRNFSKNQNIGQKSKYFTKTPKNHFLSRVTSATYLRQTILNSDFRIRHTGYISPYGRL